MKYLIHIWLIIMVLASVLASCNRVPDYDRRLASADSLMYTQFDTTLARLTSIDPNSLGKSADRAYYSLLLTQARYMNYIPISGDSNAINASIDFFEHHRSEHEKLARA